MILYIWLTKDEPDNITGWDKSIEGNSDIWCSEDYPFGYFYVGY